MEGIRGFVEEVDAVVQKISETLCKICKRHVVMLVIDASRWNVLGRKLSEYCLSRDIRYSLKDTKPNEN